MRDCDNFEVAQRPVTRGTVERLAGRILLMVTIAAVALSFLLANCGGSPGTGQPGELPRADPEAVGLSSQRLERVTDAMQAGVDQGHLPGAIGVVARRGSVAYWSAVGMADIESGKQMADDTIFRIYSMTKPIVGVALMTLYEEGRFALRDAVRRHIPELGGLRVMEDGELVKARREMTIQDLMRHTAGLAYGFSDSPVDDLYEEAGVLSDNRSVDDFIQKLAKIPLKHHPGSVWEYSVSVDVQGRLIEVLSGQDLATFLRERIFEPLDMHDTGFTVPAEKRGRFAQMYLKNEDETGIEPAPEDRSEGYFDYESRWYSGGGGLVSTTRDYLRFAQMLLNGGELNGTRILGPKTIELMSRDHVPGLPRPFGILGAGYGFGLDFAVHTDLAASGLNGTVGEYNWSGLAGTTFWIDPVEEMVGLYMIQMLPPRYSAGGAQFKRLAYQSIAD